MPTTPIFGLPYPDTTYPDGWVQGTALAVGGVEDNLLSSLMPSFADSTARDAAIPAPDTGQWVQQADDEARYRYDGSAWRPFDTKWQTFTPTLTNVTVGNGTSLGWKFRIGKLEHWKVYLLLGSSSSISGQIQITTPAMQNSISLEDVGTVFFRDASVPTNYPVGVALKSGSTTVGVYAANVAGTYPVLAGTSSTVPFTWTTSDFFHVTFTIWLA